MRTISAAEVSDAVHTLVISANLTLPRGVSAALDRACDSEQCAAACAVLRDLVDNREIAAERRLPLCQDTGMCVFFCEVGQEVYIDGGFEDAINDGVRRGYADGSFRASVVSDPLRRENTGDNTPAVIHTRLVPGDKIKIVFTPKGFGSENMSAMKMFNPTSAQSEIEDFIVSVAVNAGANPCPPVVLGVALGGTVDSAAVAAKLALCAEVGEPNPDAFYDAMERRVLDKINRLGVGAMGMGGAATALGVRITPLATHIAGLPCVVNVCCHCARHGEIVL